MKKLIIGCTCLMLVTLPAVVLANLSGIYIVDQEYHVEGWAGNSLYPEWYGYEEYDFTSTSPVSGIAYASEHCWSASSAGPFCVYAEADGESYFASAWAESYVTFQVHPLTIALELTIDYDEWWYPYAQEPGWPWIGTQIWLTDTTEERSLVRTQSPFEPYSEQGWYWEGHGVGTETHLLDNIDPTHTYGLRILSYAEAGDDWWRYDINATINAVIPTPGALMLSVIGVGLVGWLRRRRKL